MRRPIFAVLTAAALAGGGIAAAATLPSTMRPAAVQAPGAAALGLPTVKHVWIVVLENKSYAESFTPTTQAPYLLDLAKKGALLQQYYGIAHFSLPNYIALVSGQGPNIGTQSDCQQYDDVKLTAPLLGPDGQAIGQGCVFPSIVKTVADQLAAKGLSWKGYMEDLGKQTGRENPACGQPTVKNLLDDTQTAAPDDQYAARHNPFVYFHSLIDGPCVGHVAPLEPALRTDLAAASSTPAYSFITPNLCDDGHDSGGCNGPDVAGGKSYGLSAVNLWLKKYIPLILASPAYKDDGMLVVTWDEAAAATSAGDGKADADGCCDEQTVPANTPRAAGAATDISGIPSIVGSGGGRTGAIVLSPLVKPGTVSTKPYNHYSLLRTVEDLYGLPHLGYAGQATGVQAFGPDVFTASTTTPVRQPTKTPAKTPAKTPTKTPTITAPGNGLAATGLDALLPLAATLLLVAAAAVRRRRVREA
ncbi:MAG TPA: alkaline phosphatase family protein [Mycobacteriales bacterium]|nr:alkaline phosphatase family protein [Mycobacteriales bacterium]